MKRKGGLYETFCSMVNLYKAVTNAQKAKRYKTATALFNLSLEQNLLDLQEQLKSETYKFGEYYSFLIHDPKQRLISAAPYVDRLVHHAVCNIIEPIFERKFIYDLYSNRRGKGTHKAVDRYQIFCRLNKYVLKCDIRKYFASINKEILYQEISKKIKDVKLLGVIRNIIFSFDQFEPTGIPIGNLTSQLFANIYLDRMDHYIKEVLGCRYYIRYVDDFVIFDIAKEHLQNIKLKIEKFLTHYQLELHSKKSHVRQVKEGVRFLGYIIFPTHRLLDKANLKRFRRRLKHIQKLYARDQITLDKVFQRLNSWNAHAAHADSYKLRKRIFEEAVFVKG